MACSDWTFSAIEDEVNGPRPCIAFQIETNAIHNRDKLRPPEPKRTVAQSKNGSGAYIKAGIALGEPGCELNTKTLIATVPIARKAASTHRMRGEFLIQKRPFVPQSTMAGTRVSSANAFVRNRVPLSAQ